MGLIYWWSRAASLMPEVVNFAASAPGLGPLLKAAGGIHQDRSSLPKFARQTFRSWFDGRGRRRGARKVVVGAGGAGSAYPKRRALEVAGLRG